MQKFCFIHILLIFISLSSFAQTGTHVYGQVNDTSGKPLGGTTITILKTTDSSLAALDIADDLGKFDILVTDTANVFVTFSQLGYTTRSSGAIHLVKNGKVQVPDMPLAATTGQLKDVSVVAKKQLVEVHADKIVFNVENSINATGSDAMELLRKSPGVLVDQNDNITVKGKSGVKIYIDGKMQELDSKDLAAYLRSINSNDIEAIEMISNPGAKYDASGNAGIINIRLKKNKNFGTNGSVSFTGTEGIHGKTNGSVDLNYRDKKINIFGNLGGAEAKNESGLNLNRRQLDTDYVQTSTRLNQYQGINLKTGLDYFLDARNTFGILETTNINTINVNSTSNANIYDESGDFVKKLVAYNTIPHSNTNNNLNLNYRYADTSGRELNVDADYGLFRGRGSSMQPNYYLDPFNNPIATIINSNYTPTNIDIYTFKADWEQKLGSGKLGFGGKIASVTTKNAFDFYDVNNNVPVEDPTMSNSFRYTENVNAAYVNYNTALSKKWSIQGGLRVENTQSKGELTRADGTYQPDDTVKKSYSDLFPSGALTFNMNAKNTFNLTYSRRIDRPSYQDLNPFETKLDELTYEKGNAFLAPQYTDVVEFTHTFMSKLNSTLSYSYVHDYATQVTDTVANASYVQQRNLATQQILSLTLGAPITITKWWNCYFNVSYMYQYFTGIIDVSRVTETIPSFNGYLQQTFTLGHEMTAEISGNYEGSNVWGVTWKTAPDGGIDLGLQKQLWEKRASVKVSFTDIFYTYPWKATSNFGGMYVQGSGFWESRTARLSFTYRFGSNQVSQARERKTGMESEQGRIKG